MIDIMQFQHFHFLRPEWFVIVGAMYLLLTYFAQKDDFFKRWKNVMSPEILAAVTVEGNRNKWVSPLNFAKIALLLVAIITAGPTWKQQPSPFTEDNSALIIALDLSQTMDQGDVQPSRLLRAKQKINELLELRGDTNTALIAYAGSAHVVMPITNDREMIRHFLDSLESNMMPVSGKSPANVLPLAERLLTPTEVPGTLLMIGDGAHSETALKFGNFFDVQNHQLIFWGVGKTASEISDDAGTNIIAMQEDNIDNLVDESNGRFIRMADTGEDVERVNQYIENNLVIVDDAARPWHESSYPLIVLLALVYLFWFRKGWTLSW